ncbi:hypothetical protein BH09BAC4_BH09BAC4_23460 [soil metagenome]
MSSSIFYSTWWPKLLWLLFTWLLAVVLSTSWAEAGLIEKNQPNLTDDCLINQPVVKGTPVCSGPGQSVVVDLSLRCALPTGTSLLYVLSDANGVFNPSSPVVIGTLFAGSVNGKVNFNNVVIGLPATVPPSTGYRVQIWARLNGQTTATSPASEPFTIASPVTGVTPTLTNLPVCSGGKLSVSFGTSCPAPGNTVYNFFVIPQGTGLGTPIQVGSSSAAGIIQFTLPTTLSVNKEYRVQISTGISPNISFSELSEPFTITGPVAGQTPTISTLPVCAGSKLKVLFGTGCPAPGNTIYNFFLTQVGAEVSTPIPIGTSNAAGGISLDLPTTLAVNQPYRLYVSTGTGASLSQSLPSETFTINGLLTGQTTTLKGLPACSGGALTASFGVNCSAPANTTYKIFVAQQGAEPATPILVGTSNGYGDVTITLPTTLAVNQPYRLYVSTGTGASLSQSLLSEPFILQGSCSPVISVNPTSLSGFTNTGSMPSAEQTYQLTGTNLPSTNGSATNLTITAPAGFEFDPLEIGFSNFQSISGDGIHTVKVRLKAGLAPGVYSGNITHSNSAITTVNLPVSGTVSSALPVGLVSFTAKVQEDRSVKLDWTTSWETANKGFLIERSNDLKRFENVGEVTDVSTDSKALTKYTLVDQIPYRGTSYYRLTQLDLSGKTTVYLALSVVLRDEAYGVFPNPVGNDGQLALHLDDPETAVLNLYSANGQALSLQKAGIEAGNLLLRMPENLSAGVYILTVNERGQLRRHRIVVK